MVLPCASLYASEIALFVTGHPSKEWLAKAKKQADDGDESESASLTIIEGDFTGWYIEKLAKYLVDNFADPESPVAYGSFIVADEESEETDSFLLVELTPQHLLRDRSIVIEGTLCIGPEHGVGMPVIFHGGIESIGIFAGEPGDILRATEVTNVGELYPSGSEYHDLGGTETFKNFDVPPFLSRPGECPEFLTESNSKEVKDRYSLSHYQSTREISGMRASRAIALGAKVSVDLLPSAIHRGLVILYGAPFGSMDHGEYCRYQWWAPLNCQDFFVAYTSGWLRDLVNSGVVESREVSGHGIIAEGGSLDIQTNTMWRLGDKEGGQCPICIGDSWQECLRTDSIVPRYLTEVGASVVNTKFAIWMKGLYK
ncbi:hypothetical protein IW262DRAFT_1291095 [Armillaria fumosa]|nr:hypothetical protein IW262DRAFT_1291095 [Armillaria fumosa]